MGQPVKLSDEMILEARVAGAAMGRSIAGQVEFWARLGKTLDRVMTGDQVTRLIDKEAALKLTEILDSVDKPAGRKRLADYLASKPFPRFKAHPGGPRTYIRENADGTETAGRFIGREFVPISGDAVEPMTVGLVPNSPVSRRSKASPRRP
jgi:hypothetical protein